MITTAREPHDQVAQLNSAEPSRSLNYRREKAAGITAVAVAVRRWWNRGRGSHRLPRPIDLLTVARASLLSRLSLSLGFERAREKESSDSASANCPREHARLLPKSISPRLERRNFSCIINSKSPLSEARTKKQTLQVENIRSDKKCTRYTPLLDCQFFE